MSKSSSDNAELVRHLRQQYMEIAQLAGSLAHEIKNPLAVIRMNMDLLAEDFDAPKDQEQRRIQGKVEVVRGQCERLERLLDDFLRFARVRDLQLSPASLNDQVTRVLDFYEAQGREDHIEVIRYLDPDLPSIMIDAGTIYAALLNLVLNAAQAMPDGGSLTVRSRTTKNGVALDLIDTGRGMNPETAMKMFDPFYTTKEGGSGLGLPTAKKIIEAHGGWIDVQSDENRGTKFTLFFPTPARLPGS